MNLNNYVVMDVETKRTPDEVDGGWENPEGMGLSSAVVYDYSRDQYVFFLHMVSLGKLVRYLHDRTVVTFNGIKFDSRVILGNDRLSIDDIVCKELRLFTWSNYDILLEYIKSRFNIESVGEAEKKLGDKTIHDGSFSLDGLAEGTLGLRKSGHGALAPILYREGKYDELLEYNLHDVRITKKLFDFILKNGFVVDRNDNVVRMGQ